MKYSTGCTYATGNDNPIVSSLYKKMDGGYIEKYIVLTNGRLPDTSGGPPGRQEWVEFTGNFNGEKEAERLLAKSDDYNTAWYAEFTTATFRDGGNVSSGIIIRYDEDNNDFEDNVEYINDYDYASEGIASMIAEKYEDDVKWIIPALYEMYTSRIKEYVPEFRLGTDEPDVVYEWCPFCDTEVELANDFVLQECPSCGKLIKPCTMCDPDDPDRDCVKCLLYRKTIPIPEYTPEFVLHAQQDKVGKHKTKIYEEDGYTKVKYHDTDVIAFNDREIILDSGGWHSNTTKSRINQACNQFGLGCGVFQKNYSWYVLFGQNDFKNPLDFHDGIVLERNIETIPEYAEEFVLHSPLNKKSEIIRMVTELNRRFGSHRNRNFYIDKVYSYYFEDDVYLVIDNDDYYHAGMIDTQIVKKYDILEGSEKDIHDYRFNTGLVYTGDEPLGGDYTGCEGMNTTIGHSVKDLYDYWKHLYDTVNESIPRFAEEFVLHANTDDMPTFDSVKVGDEFILTNDIVLGTKSSNPIDHKPVTKGKKVVIVRRFEKRYDNRYDIIEFRIEDTILGNIIIRRESWDDWFVANLQRYSPIPEYADEFVLHAPFTFDSIVVGDEFVTKNWTNLPDSRIPPGTLATAVEEGKDGFLIKIDSGNPRKEIKLSRDDGWNWSWFIRHFDRYKHRSIPEYAEEFVLHAGNTSISFSERCLNFILNQILNWNITEMDDYFSIRVSQDTNDFELFLAHPDRIMSKNRKGTENDFRGVIYDAIDELFDYRDVNVRELIKSKRVKEDSLFYIEVEEWKSRIVLYRELVNIILRTADIPTFAPEFKLSSPKMKKTPTIAIDLDGTILESNHLLGPLFYGKPLPGAIDALHRIRDDGNKIVIFTRRKDNPRLRKHLEKYKIPYDDINKTPWIKTAPSSAKPMSQVYIDDRMIRFDGDWSKYPDIVDNFVAWYKTTNKTHKRVGIDFDGVIANYKGWLGEDKFAEPVPGASEALHEIRNRGHEIVISTTRRDTPALRKYLKTHNIPFDAINEEPGLMTSGKPSADLYIDDRGFTFTNNWSEFPDILKGLQPWNRTDDYKAGIDDGYYVRDIVNNYIEQSDLPVTEQAFNFGNEVSEIEYSFDEEITEKHVENIMSNMESHIIDEVYRRYGIKIDRETNYIFQIAFLKAPLSFTTNGFKILINTRDLRPKPKKFEKEFRLHAPTKPTSLATRIYNMVKKAMYTPDILPTYTKDWNQYQFAWDQWDNVDSLFPEWGYALPGMYTIEYFVPDQFRPVTAREKTHLEEALQTFVQKYLEDEGVHVDMDDMEKVLTVSVTTDKNAVTIDINNVNEGKLPRSATEFVLHSQDSSVSPAEKPRNIQRILHADRILGEKDITNDSRTILWMIIDHINKKYPEFALSESFWNKVENRIDLGWEFDDMKSDKWIYKEIFGKLQSVIDNMIRDTFNTFDDDFIIIDVLADGPVDSNNELQIKIINKDIVRNIPGYAKEFIL